jgi:NADH-quinone oxidoreductase subunit C
MTFQEIASRLQAAFPDAVVEVKSEGVVEPSVKVAPGKLRDVALALRSDPDLKFDYLMCLSGVDLGKETLGVVYHLGSMEHRHKITVRTDVPAAEPRVPTVSDIWPTANWHEREAWSASCSRATPTSGGSSCPRITRATRSARTSRCPSFIMA